MLTPSWETSAGALAALLNGTTATQLVMADLYSITLAGGAVLRYTAHDQPLTVAGLAFGVGPLLKRSRITLSVGIAVDSLTLQLAANASVSVNGVPMVQFISAGGLANARLLLERLYCDAAGTPVGTLIAFTGRVADIAGGRYEKTITVKSDTELLDVMIPRDVYQPGCKNTLFDARCGLARASYAVISFAGGASDATRTSFSFSSAYAAGYFELGVCTFTSGANLGISRTVRSHTSGALGFAQPWPFAVAAADVITLTPGCDKTLGTCTAKFANRARFRGEPFIPAPETVT